MNPPAAPCRAIFFQFCLLFLPAGPAFLWLWPNIPVGTPLHDLAQVLAYLYFAAGAAWIGRRSWAWAGLGVSWQGLGLSLGSGAAILVLLVCGRLAINPPLQLGGLEWPKLAWQIVFYIGCVGGCEEFLFRGLLYRILEDWKGPALALFGSSAGFALWHIGWANPLQLAGVLVIGLLFGLIRWRAGGITGLVVVHGLYDIVNIYLYQGLDRDSITLQSIANRGYAVLGDIVLLGLLVYLLFLQPRLARPR